MSIELAATQAMRKDKLGLTLRDRMWLARVALTTMVLSAIAFPVLLTMLPAETQVPAGQLETRLAARELTPIAVVPASVEPLPVPEVQRPQTFVALEPAPEPAPAAPAVSAAVTHAAPPPVQVLRASKRGVVVSRGKLSARELVGAPAVDLSRPQPLAPTRAPEPAPEPEPIRASPVAEEPALKRPALD